MVWNYQAVGIVSRGRLSVSIDISATVYYEKTSLFNVYSTNRTNECVGKKKEEEGEDFRTGEWSQDRVLAVLSLEMAPAGR